MAEKKGTALSSIQGFPAEVIQKLADLWITTAEELVSAAVQEGGLAGLVTYLGLPETEVSHLVDQAVAALPPGVSFAAGDVQPHGLGALDEREEGGEGGIPPSFAPLPDKIDLHQRFGPVRNQGQRGTCVAHACTAVREYLSGAQSAKADLSEQFLYWDCKEHDLIPGAGTFIRVAMNRLELDGIPQESDWPYNPNPIRDNEAQDPPPSGIMDKASPNRIHSFAGLAPTNVDALRQALANDSPVAFSVPVYAHWWMKPTQSTGDVRLPLPGEKVEGGHAMCMVGYEADLNVPGGGYFLVRNSWGEDWAKDQKTAEEVPMPGYARIPYAYINQYGTSAYIASVGTSSESLWQRLRNWIRNLSG